MNNAARTTDKSATTATRHIGFCAFCEGDWKLDADNRLVHHGYKRPGDGAIAGDCLGVSQAPYEVSAEPLKAYATALQNQLRELIAARERHLCVSYFEVFGTDRRTKKMTVDSYSKLVTPAYVWDRAHYMKLGNMNRHIDGVKREIARIEKHIAAWTPKAVRSVEELVEKRELAKKASDEKRAAAKKIRDEKAAALQAKKDKRAADIAAFIQAIRLEAGRLVTVSLILGKGDKGYQRDLAKLATKVKKAYNAWSIAHHTLSTLGCDDALVALGFAVRETSWNGSTYLRALV
jgi:hypothetical protein